jgi:two-component system response regulator NreC
MTTIALADDHHIVRQGLRRLLEDEPDFQVVGDTGDGLEALQPDVLVIDLAMPGLSGLEVTRQVCQRSPQTRVIILSMYANEAYVLEALKNGAAGYVLKESSGVDLVLAMREALAGRRYLSPPLSEHAIEAYLKKVDTGPPDPYETLTAREREVLHLAAEGHTNNQIAKRLSISPRTVETHRANLMRKLGLNNHAELIRYALGRGILK